MPGGAGVLGGYCLELVCADFLAGRTEESTAEEILMLIQHMVKLLPPEYKTRLASQERDEELEGGCCKTSNRLNSDGRCIGV
jgi:hypothetical protein